MLLWTCFLELGIIVLTLQTRKSKLSRSTWTLNKQTKQWLQQKNCPDIASPLNRPVQVQPLHHWVNGKSLWAVGCVIHCRAWAGFQKGPALSVLIQQTPPASQSYKHQLSTLPPHLKNMFHVVFNRGLCLIDPGLAACRVRGEREKKSIRIPGCSAVSKFTGWSLLSLSLLNCRGTALCPNFEQGSWGHSSTSWSRQLVIQQGN